MHDLYSYKDKLQTTVWNRKAICSNNLKCTNGKRGFNNVLREFTDFYTGVVQPNTTNADLLLETDVEQLLTDKDQYNHTVTPRVDICDVERCIRNLKRHKAAGHGNVTSEHLIFGGPHLTAHLTVLFNSMIHHCFVPNDFCNGIILPVLKSKHGDDMYRGITLSPVISKVFESVLLHLYDEFLSSDSLQYGFKENSIAVRYFTKKGSRVYCAFLDASKAFDKVL